MPGKLYLVATPIGNLGDISQRCAQILEEADFIAAEDTRVSVKLLNHLGIKKPMVSYYEHNARQSGARILERLLAGENCALVTDAGMPAISDPGEDLVRQCAEAGVEVVAVPGPSALIAAVALSGLSTSRFTFEGFLPTARKDRQKHLGSLREETRTMVFYEAPHKLRGTLADLRDHFGADRALALCRELTKLHEEVLRLTLGEACDYYRETEPRGEFVLVVSGKPAEESGSDPAAALERALELAENGLSARDAVRQAAEEFSVSRSELYRLFQEARKKLEE